MFVTMMDWMSDWKDGWVERRFDCTEQCQMDIDEAAHFLCTTYTCTHQLRYKVDSKSRSGAV